MKVAISSTGDRLTSEVDSRFGRCPYFIVVDTSDMSHEAFANTHAELSSGAGIQAAGFLAEKEVQSVLTGNCGPKASQAFAAAGIDVFTGYAGTVKAALEAFQQNNDSGPMAAAGSARSVAPGPQSMPGAMAGGQGMGGGRGMGGGGCGRGRGGGRGMGGARGMTGVMAPPSGIGPSREEALAELKEQAAYLRQQMAAVEGKIKELDEKK